MPLFARRIWMGWWVREWPCWLGTAECGCLYSLPFTGGFKHDSWDLPEHPNTPCLQCYCLLGRFQTLCEAIPRNKSDQDAKQKKITHFKHYTQSNIILVLNTIFGLRKIASCAEITSFLHWESPAVVCIGTEVAMHCMKILLIQGVSFGHKDKTEDCNILPWEKVMAAQEGFQDLAH